MTDLNRDDRGLVTFSFFAARSIVTFSKSQTHGYRSFQGGNRLTKNGAPERIRTTNLLIRSQMLYPVELRALKSDFTYETPSKCSSSVLFHIQNIP